MRRNALGSRRLPLLFGNWTINPKALSNSSRSVRLYQSTNFISIPSGFAGRIYGGSRAPSRIGLGVPGLPGWNGESYNDSKRFLFSMGPSKFVKPVPKKDTSKFVCPFSDEDEDVIPPKSKKQEMLDLMEAAMMENE